MVKRSKLTERSVFKSLLQRCCVMLGTVSVCASLVVQVGCETNNLKEIRAISQDLDAAKTKSDDLRNAIRYLAQVTPLNREAMSKEVQLYLNKWLQNSPVTEKTTVAADLLDGLPPDLRSASGLDNINSNLFTIQDVEYMFQCRLLQQLSTWVVANPVRDSLLKPGLETLAAKLPQEQYQQVEQACKLFDWVARNVALQANPKDVETLSDDPRAPINDAGLGYGYLPWESILYSRGDFIERGRVFCALAQQRGLATTWIALRLPNQFSAKLWAVGVVVGENVYVFEPKLNLPILNPDTLQLATLKEIQAEPRILRRCDVPGRFDYAVNPGDVAKVEFLLDVEPAAISPRMLKLEKSLLADERMILASNATEVQSQLKKAYPEVRTDLWQTPLLAQMYAARLRASLQMNSESTFRYMIEHAIWTNETPSSRARLKHLQGEFESTIESEGALKTYMETRLPDEMLSRLPDDPDIQREIGINRYPGEELPQFQGRLRAMQQVLGRAKLDANFLLGELQFDLGNYESAEGWLKKRTLGDKRASMWFPAAWYTLARTYQEENKLTEALDALTQEPSPTEAGNRLRMRYLSKESTQEVAPESK